jgi:hypothetical protein
MQQPQPQMPAMPLPEPQDIPQRSMPSNNTPAPQPNGSRGQVQFDENGFPYMAPVDGDGQSQLPTDDSQSQPQIPASQPATPPVTPTQQAAILQLAHNDDLNVATLAREAQRSEAADGEVVIKLH